MKLLRVFRLSRIIQYMNTTDDIKHTLKLFKLVFWILLYINFSACFWYTISYNHYLESKEKGSNEHWLPLNYNAKIRASHGNTGFYDLEPNVKLLYTCYNLMLVLFGNDIGPKSPMQFFSLCVFLMAGALVNAGVFGTIAVIC